MEHAFTQTILTLLEIRFGNEAKIIFQTSYLLQYLNIKMRSANRSSKSRANYANLYAIYVLVEDYISKGFHQSGNYSRYDGARFSDLMTRQRQLAFGEKLQNHALNNRTNDEFRKYFAQQTDHIPIIRDLANNRYWINEHLLVLSIQENNYNLAAVVLEIINAYVETKRSSFEEFIRSCERLKLLNPENYKEVQNFLSELLSPQTDARIFEIVSFAILKYYYRNQIVFFGFSLDQLSEEHLKLYKTGRTNANDGGIDFVMKPLGRFFQVTESKYFLDIDKIERYSISFVIKSSESVDTLQQLLRNTAEKQYPILSIVDKYMASIEEIINVPILEERFRDAVQQGFLRQILDEIILQSKVEFNIDF